MRKTQFFAAELIFVMLLFITIFYISIVVWNNKINQLNTNLKTFDIQLGSANIAEELIMTPGKPLNWSISSVEQLGLADDYGIINSYKLDNFFYMCENNYSLMQELLGIPEYDFYVIIEDLNGTIVRNFSNYTVYERESLFRQDVVINDIIYKFKIGVVN